MLFSEFPNITLPTIQALEQMNIVSPTEIQEGCISHILQSSDNHVIAQSKTGSGKTLAYAIPIVEHIDINLKQVQAIVLVPTRELAKQVHKVFISLTKFKKIRTVEVYGGVGYSRQINQIHKGAQIVIATTGRLMDIYRKKQVKFDHCKFVALDEADRMLDMGFIPDIRYLLLDAMVDISPRLMLFSATMADKIKKLISDFTKDTNLIDINISQDSLVVPDVEQIYFYSHSNKNKYRDFVSVLEAENPEYSIIFTATKQMAEILSERLNKERHLGLRTEFINGDLTQSKREAIIRKFRSKTYNCIIGTNVLARGLDFPRVSHVFNYDIPREEQEYVHRIGRTARVSGKEKDIASGIAITMISSGQKRDLRRIENLIGMNLKKGEISKLVYKPRKPSSFDNIPRKSYDDKPKKSYDRESKPRRSYNDKPRRSHGDKPRKSYNDKPSEKKPESPMINKYNGKKTLKQKKMEKRVKTTLENPSKPFENKNYHKKSVRNHPVKDKWVNNPPKLNKKKNNLRINFGKNSVKDNPSKLNKKKNNDCINHSVKDDPSELNSGKKSFEGNHPVKDKWANSPPKLNKKKKKRSKSGGNPSGNDKMASNVPKKKKKKYNPPKNKNRTPKLVSNA